MESAYYNPATLTPVYYNYQYDMFRTFLYKELFTLNNIRFHKQKTGMVLYGGVGIGATIYDTKVNALNAKHPYSFNSITGSGYSEQKRYS